METKILPIIKKAVIEVLELKTDIKLSKKTRLKEELGLDSLSSLALILKIEEMVDGFIIDAENFEPNHLETIETLCLFVEHQIKKG